VSATSCRAVGYFASTAAPTQEAPLGYAWNGTKWSVEELPLPAAPGPKNALEAISCEAATACLAVGDVYTSSSKDVPLTEAWNGTSWTPQELAPASGTPLSTLHGVSCTATGKCTAVGWSTPGGGSTKQAPFVERFE